MTEKILYRGRFAPSPTGDLHFGSLVSAVASYADALQHKGDWLLRFDNADQTRTRKDAIDSILRTLEVLGFEWSGKPAWQTDRIELYQDVLDKLLLKGLAFYCGCSRKEIELAKPHTTGRAIYPGTCRNSPPLDKQRRSIRLRVENEETRFFDRFAGPIRQNVAEEIGDFVIQRTDGFIAYQLAVVVDDRLENITHVVRGADLLDSTPRQLYLQKQLGFPSPIYGHVPLVVDSFGEKLSKNKGAPALNLKNPIGILFDAWKFLGQTPLNHQVTNIYDFWSAAGALWTPQTN